MATVSHTIYSRYPAKQREDINGEVSLDQEETADPWQTESSFQAQRSLSNAPSFVTAKKSYDAWGSLHESEVEVTHNTVESNTAVWYRSLTNTGANERVQQSVQPFADPSKISSKKSKKLVEKRNKSNWFITRALQSGPSSALLTPSPDHTLADMLARDPPPLPAEQKYNPPVWLALGPSNKGFKMLQQSGWNEGEGLGSRIQRRALASGGFMKDDSGLIKGRKLAMKQEELEVQWGDGIREVRNVDVIDLTLSDSEEDRTVADRHSEALSHLVEPPAVHEPLPNLQTSHSPTALLTPIATVLKSDRLGIGLKAKTVGPYKTSQKRITHNAAALAAHIRTAEATKKKKASMGRGRRGFAKMAKREQEARQRLLAYLNE